MSKEALQACVDRHLEHAAMVFILDDKLGTHHGLSWADFVLLTMLDAAGGAVLATELARTLRTPASRGTGNCRERMWNLMSTRQVGIVERTRVDLRSNCQRPCNGGQHLTDQRR